MSNVIIPTRFQWRQDTAANWTANNPTMLEGEPGLETDTTWPNGGGRKFKIGDGVTAWNSLPYAVADTADPSTFDPSASFYLYDDFLGTPPSSTAPNGDGSAWDLALISTGGAVTSVDGGPTSPGVWRISCGTTSTAAASITMGATNNWSFGGGAATLKFRFRIPTLSTSGQRFSITLGFRQNFAGATTDQVALAYSDNINSGKPILRVIAGGATVDVNCTTTLAANTWYRGKIIVNAAGTQADLYINGTLEATTATGVPTAAMKLGCIVGKSVGATSMSVDLDYIELAQTLATPR